MAPKLEESVQFLRLLDNLDVVAHDPTDSIAMERSVAALEAVLLFLRFQQEEAETNERPVRRVGGE